MLAVRAAPSADTSLIELYERLYTTSQSLTKNQNRTSHALQLGQRGIVLLQTRDVTVHGRHRAKLGSCANFNKSSAQTVTVLITLNSGGTTMLQQAKADEKKTVGTSAFFFFFPVPTDIRTNLQRRRGVESSISRKARKPCCAWSTAVFVSTHRCAHVCGCRRLRRFPVVHFCYATTRTPACDGPKVLFF